MIQFQLGETMQHVMAVEDLYRELEDDTESSVGTVDSFLMRRSSMSKKTKAESDGEGLKEAVYAAQSGPESGKTRRTSGFQDEAGVFRCCIPLCRGKKKKQNDVSQFEPNFPQIVLST